MTTTAPCTLWSVLQKEKRSVWVPSGMVGVKGRHPPPHTNKRCFLYTRIQYIHKPNKKTHNNHNQMTNIHTVQDNWQCLQVAGKRSDWSVSLVYAQSQQFSSIKNMYADIKELFRFISIIGWCRVVSSPLCLGDRKRWSRPSSHIKL